RQGRSVAVTGAESDEQGRQVLGSGMRVADRRGAVDKVGQLVDIAVFEGFVRPGVEFGRPRRRRRVQAKVAEKRQTVGQEAAADHQHALVAKRAQPAADFEELLGIEARHRDLEHRHVGSRIHHGERHVGAVVKPAIGLFGNRLIGKQAPNVGGQLRRARRWISCLVIALGKATEVIDERRAGARRADRQWGVFPVGRDHQDRGRTRQGVRPGGQLGDPQPVVNQRRCAVADVQGGHPAGGVRPSRPLGNDGGRPFRRQARARRLRLQFFIHLGTPDNSRAAPYLPYESRFDVGLAGNLFGMAADHSVHAEGLVKRYGRVQALDGLDLHVDQGSLLALLGPNGAGKTTAVRILTTLLEPDAGHATVAGFDVVKDADRIKSLIGLAGQSVAIDEYLTGRENLEMIGQLYHISRRDAKRRAEELLVQFELRDAADRIAKTYSGGMRRRLDLAASLVLLPPVLFLDEPTTGLDPRSRRQVWGMISSLVNDGSTILLTTQYLEEADELANRIAVVGAGRVSAEGPAGGDGGRVDGQRQRRPVGGNPLPADLRPVATCLGHPRRAGARPAERP